MKKCTTSLIILLLVSVFAFSQNKQTVFDKDNLYHKALEAVLKKRLVEYGDITEKEELTNITILKEFRTIDLPNKISEFGIDYLNDEELFIKYKKYRKRKQNGESMEIMRVFPMTYKNSRIVIRFNDTHYSRKDSRNRINVSYGLEGGSNVTFSYNCETKQFDVEKVELWGI